MEIAPPSDTCLLWITKETIVSMSTGICSSHYTCAFTLVKSLWVIKTDCFCIMSDVSQFFILELSESAIMRFKLQTRSLVRNITQGFIFFIFILDYVIIVISWSVKLETIQSMMFQHGIFFIQIWMYSLQCVTPTWILSLICRCLKCLKTRSSLIQINTYRVLK